MRWVGYVMLQCAVVRQQQETLRVPVESAGCIEAITLRDRQVAAQSGAIRRICELAENIKGFVEQQNTRHDVSLEKTAY